MREYASRYSVGNIHTAHSTFYVRTLKLYRPDFLFTVLLTHFITVRCLVPTYTRMLSEALWDHRKYVREPERYTEVTGK